ncbi:hypothetical protein GC197_15940 [bacterium]|nr:hypothetical protein [bacterium]
MDPLELTHYRVAAENGFLKFRRTAFQEWLGNILTKRYCDDFMRIRLSKGDGGLDGYRLSTRTVYQVFAPREYTASAMADKIRDDFAHAKSTLVDNDLEMSKWIFVHNDPDDLPHEAVTELAKLQRDNPTVAIRRWDFTAIWKEIKQLSKDELVELFGAAPTLELLEDLCYQDIIPVIEHLATEKSPPLPPTDPPSPQKLEFNDLSKDRADYIRRGRSKQGLVESYLAEMPEEDKPEEIAEAFRKRYTTHRDADLDADQTFDELWQFAGGRVFAAEPVKLAGVMAVLAFYFDSCDIFENPPESEETI